MTDDQEKEGVRQAGNQTSGAARRGSGLRRMQECLDIRTGAAEMHELGWVQHQRVVTATGRNRRGMGLSVAGLTVAIESNEPDLDIQPQGAISRFVATTVASELTVRTCWAPQPPRH